MTEKAQKEFNKIISDKTSGSTDLLLKLNGFLKKYFLDLENQLWFIENAKKEFGPFQNIQIYLRKLEINVKNNNLSQSFFDYQITKYNSVYDKIYKNTFPYLANVRSVLTISNSRTIFEIIKRLGEIKTLKLIVCEARPKLEGRILAKKAASSNVKVEMITEAMAAGSIVKSDCVLIGADQILKDGSVVNKIGSLQLALLCKQFKKPFYVAAEKSKFSRNNKFLQKEESTDEIWKNHPEEIAIKNFYFENIPGSVITRIFTDK
jgi:translation initiation factor 2B subunit (eIF-2B alpha/beta/delta family)